MTGDEHELLQQAQAGDYDAFNHLHQILEPPITRFVNRLVGGPGPQAEDIVQDTFLSLFVHLDKIDPVENLRPYVFRIARNACYDVLRRQGRFEEVSMDDDDEPISLRVSFDLSQTQGSLPEDTVHWVLLHLEVQQAMEYLPELQRQALILYAEEGMSYPEIAEIMETTVGTIKSRIFHARRTLRSLMKPETLAALKDELSPQSAPQTAPQSDQDSAHPPERLALEEPSKTQIKKESSHGREHHSAAQTVHQGT